MILLDTHIWIWWVSQPQKLQERHFETLVAASRGVLGVSVISCWEIAKLVQLGRLRLDRDVAGWIEDALDQPGIVALPLSARIVVESTRLPEPFHRDPADQLIVATARILNCALMTEDSKIVDYPHVRIA